MSHFDEPPKQSTNNPKLESDTPNESHNEDLPVDPLQVQLVDLVSNGKWHDTKTINMFTKWRDKIIQNLYESNKELSDEDVFELYQKQAEELQKILESKIPISEDKEKFLFFIRSNNIL